MDEPDISFCNETVMVIEEVDDTVCAICWAEFLDAEDLKTHVTQVHLTERRRLRYCEICSQIFPDIERCMSHYLFVHMAKLKCCKHCFRLFPDIASKMLHEKKHKFRSKKEIICSQCTESFNDKIYLERHEYSAHRLNGDGLMINHGFSLLSSLLNMNVRRFLTGYNEDMIYICASCQFTSHNMLAYIDHLQDSSCKAFSCEMCVNVYHNRKNLIRHFTSKHGKHNIVECPKCHVMYTKTALNVHEKTCSMLKCLDCNLTFNTVNEITNHRIERHEDCALVNTCRFCNKQIIGDNMMRKHVDRVHKSTLHLYKYKCVYCDILYKHPKFLFAHFFSSHKDIEPYTCMICNEKFRVRRKFTLHVQTVHKNVGFLEYNDKYHVSFVKEKSGTAFVPQPLYDDFYRSQTFMQRDDECPKKDQPQAPETKDKDTQSPDATSKQDEPKKNVEESQPVVVEVDRSKEMRLLKRRRAKLLNQETNESSDDSEVPLVKLRKLRKYRCPWNSTKNKKIQQILNRFLCKQCNKNCYTLQNYSHHMSLHENDVYKKCIKCKARFKSEKELNKHVEERHSNSVLTETLKKVLERRKLETDVRPEPTKQTAKRFKVTMKKVVPDAAETPAVLKEVPQPNKVSVKNFIENFTPDVSADTFKIKDCVTMGLTTELRPQKILVHKCDLKELSFTGLKKPVKAAASTENHQVTMKIVKVENVRRANLNYGTKRYNIHDVDHSYCEELNCETEDLNQSCEDDSFQTNDNEDYSRATYIPDVAQEVMLGSEEVKLQKTIIVENVPKAYKSIRIGTLQPQAPYYKIVKLDDIIQRTEPEQPEEQKHVCLPDGTQLVAVNPLAHLIDTEGIKKKMPKKYYKTKTKDINAAIRKFLYKRPMSKSRRKRIEAASTSE